MQVSTERGLSSFPTAALTPLSPLGTGCWHLAPKADGHHRAGKMWGLRELLGSIHGPQSHQAGTPWARWMAPMPYSSRVFSSENQSINRAEIKALFSGVITKTRFFPEQIQWLMCIRLKRAGTPSCASIMTPKGTCIHRSRTHVAGLLLLHFELKDPI